MVVEHETEEFIIALLSERWPQCFSVYEARRKPLKIGIRDDIIAALAGAFPAEALCLALRFYTHNMVYLKHLLAGAWRYDLDGKPTGAVTKHEEQHARNLLATRLKKATARRETLLAAKLQASIAELKSAAQRRKIAA